MAQESSTNINYRLHDRLQCCLTTVTTAIVKNDTKPLRFVRSDVKQSLSLHHLPGHNTQQVEIVWLGSSMDGRAYFCRLFTFSVHETLEKMLRNGLLRPHAYFYDYIVQAASNDLSLGLVSGHLLSAFSGAWVQAMITNVLDDAACEP